MSDPGVHPPVPVVVGLDGSADAHRALEWGAHVAAGRRDAVLHLVHALALPVVPLFHAELTVEELFARQEREAHALLDGERTRLEQRGLRVEVVLRRWLPAETLLEHANASGAGLILVGQHGRGHGRRLLGSVSGAVARGARQPVVVVRGERELAGAPRRVLLAVDRSAGAAAAAAALATWLPASEVIAVEVVSDKGETART
jgi:nucleotide-binding universal stress UspA family protein